jgi:hypothetical protein
MEPLLSLQNLAANLPARVCGCVDIEIPQTSHQILSLFRCQGRRTVNGAGYRASLYRNLWLRIRSRGRRSVKVRCSGRTSQPTELNVIFELVGFSIQRGGQRSGTRAVLGRNFRGGLQVCRQVNGCSVRCKRHQRESGYGDDGSENTLYMSQFSSPFSGWLRSRRDTGLFHRKQQQRPRSTEPRIVIPTQRVPAVMEGNYTPQVCKRMVDAGGIEPPTCRLRVECSAS